MNEMKKRSGTFVAMRMLLLLCFVGLACRGSVWYVRTGAEGGDGSSWDTALGSLQRAIDLAERGDAIWVSAGVYEPVRMREIEGEQVFATSFELKDGVSIYGGFKGDESTPGERVMKEDGIYGWEFAHATILRQRMENLGSVVRGDPQGHGQGSELNGLVIENGRALGMFEEGNGGGLQGKGELRVVNCLLQRNLARNGGAVHWEGALDMSCTGLFDNDLVSAGWCGLGGGAWVRGDGYRLTGIICTGNGTEVQGVQSGGGLYLDGEGVAIHCTIVGNQTHRNGSGVWLAGGALLENSLVWGNQGRLSQVVTEGGRTSTCGIEGWYGGGAGDIPLLSENAGPGGVEVNDNWVDGYYPCFVSVAERDFRLGAGSYALNRGRTELSGNDALGLPLAQSFPADLGACGSVARGNLAVDFSVEYPHVYGGESQVQAYFGLGTPAGLRVDFDVEAPVGALSEGMTGEWQVTWLKTGLAEVSMLGDVIGGEAGYWNQVDLIKHLQVQPRPLLVTATDVDYRHGSGEPVLEWSLSGGRLVFDDRLVGSLACDYENNLGNKVPITRGTLRVQDGNGGENYQLTFMEGELIYEKGLVELEIAGNHASYDGEPIALVLQTDPPAVGRTITYVGTQGTEYGPTEEPPTDAGSYLASVSIRDKWYEGEAEIPMVIAKAPLTITATSLSRQYGQDNPPLTMTYEGFKGKDGLEEVTPPSITTDAVPDSPVRQGGYPIRLQGGNARNYSLTLVPGVLTVVRGIPKLENVQAADIDYGDFLRQAKLSTQHRIPEGTFSWEDPDERPHAGRQVYPWQFVPLDTLNWEPVHGELAVTVAPRKVVVEVGSYEKTYGDSSPPFEVQIVAGSLVPGDRLLGKPACVGDGHVGKHVIGRGTLSLGGNYELTVTEGTLAVHPREVTLKALNVVKGVGEPDPEFAWIVSAGSLAHGDEPIGTLQRVAGEGAGSYKIQQGSLALSDNYVMHFESGVLTIQELVPLLSSGGVTPQPIDYGQQLKESVIEGIVLHPNTHEPVPGHFSWCQPEARLHAGISRQEWIFVPSAVGMSRLRGEVDIEIRKVELTVQLSESQLERPYFAVNPVFNLRYSGFVNGEGVNDLQLVPVGTTEARLTSPVGTYPVVIDGGLSRDYRFRYVSGTLEVVPGHPVMYEPVQVEEMIYGTVFDESMVSWTFVPPEPIGTIPGKLIVHGLPADGRFPAGVHTVPWEFIPVNGNFETVLGTMEIVVYRAPLFVTAEHVTLNVGELFPAAFDYRVTGWVYDDHLRQQEVIPGGIRVISEVQNTDTAGDYELRIVHGDCENYEIIPEHGKLTIKRLVPVPVGLDSMSIFYGDMLSQTPTRQGRYWMTTVGDRMVSQYLNHEIFVYWDEYSFFNGVGMQNRTARFVNPLEMESKPEGYWSGIPGTVHWDWPQELRPVGGYQQVPWRFVPAETVAGKYAEARGTCLVKVLPKIVEVYGPPVDYVLGNLPGEDLLENYEWTYRQSDVIDGAQGSGYVRCAELSGDDFRINDQRVLAGNYSWDCSHVNFGPNYRPMWRPNVKPVQGLQRRMMVQVEDRKDRRYVPQLTFATTLLNGSGESERSWEVDVDVCETAVMEKYVYRPPEACYDPLTRSVLGRYELPEDGFTRHFFQTGYEGIVDIVSREIHYGDEIPAPTFQIKFTSDLAREDVSGQPSYENLENVPGTYRIGKGTMQLHGDSERFAIVEGLLTIRKRPITVSTGPLSKFQGEGDPPPSYQIVEGSLVQGDQLVGSLERERGEQAGVYRYSLGTLNHPHYDITLAEDSVLTIRPGEVYGYDLKDISPCIIRYGEEVASGVPEGHVRDMSTGERVEGTWTWVRPGAMLPPGQHGEWAIFEVAGGSVSESVSARLSVVVLPGELTVCGDSYRIQWGDPLPALGYRVEHGVPYAGLTGALEAVPQPDGNYAITLGTLSAGDRYEVKLKNQPVIYVSPRQLVLEVLNVGKQEGESEPAFSYRMASGSLAPHDRFQDIVFQRAPGELPGSYRIDMTVGGTALDPNLEHYDITIVPGTLTVSPENAEAMDDTVAGTTLERRTAKVVVNADWGGDLIQGAPVTWGGVDYLYGTNAFSTLEEALSNVSADGVVLVAPGNYLAPTGRWFVDRGISLIGDDGGDVDSEIILTGTFEAADSRVTKLLLSNLTFVAPDDLSPAVRLGDSVGSAVIVNCQLIGGDTALHLGAYGNGVSVIYTVLTANGSCLVGSLGEGQSVPLAPLTLVCNSFEGRRPLEAEGFPILSSSNLFNGASFDSDGY